MAGMKPVIFLVLALAVCRTGGLPSVGGPGPERSGGLHPPRAAQNDGQAPDVSTDPHVFESTRLPGNMRYMATVGNGHLATAVFGDTVYMNGLYSGLLGQSHRARIPSLHSSNVTVEGHTVEDARYRLDTTRAVFEYVQTTSDAQTSAVTTYRVYAHNYYNQALVTEISIQRTGPTGSAITILQDSLNSNPDSADLTLGPSAPYVDDPQAGCGTGGYSCSMRSGTIAIPETEPGEFTPLYMYWTHIPDTFVLDPNQTEATWTHVLSVDRRNNTAKVNFDLVVEKLAERQFSEVLAEHTDGWAEVWAGGSITLEGDSTILPLQKVVRGSLYYLYSSLPSLGSTATNQFYGLSPGGLANGEAGRDYYGHVFWDMETWMYPGILLFRPDLARQMLSYRIAGTQPAKERAQGGGHEGTRYPWESAYTGVEVTPEICVPCRENQQHITGDIAFAARQYMSATRDVNWLTSLQAGTNNTGWNFIHNMARFWFTRPEYNAVTDRYDVNGVMPPDEHQQSVNNSIYTNLGANLAIHFARYASCLAGRDSEEDVPDSWLQVAQRLAFTYNRMRRYHEEYQGYEDDVINNRTHREFVKQADVVLLGFPFLWDMPDDVRENDLLEYENVTSPGGPAMTWGMFAVGWLDVGDDLKAASLFNRAYQFYYRDPFKVWTEAQEGAGAINFITGMGGFLQALVSGYGGLRLHVEELRFRRPKLPVNVTRMTFSGLHYLEAVLDVTVDASDVNVTTVSVGGFPLRLYTESGNDWDLSPGVPRIFPVQAFSINTTTPSGCPPPLDSIDVDYSPVNPLDPGTGAAPGERGSPGSHGSGLYWLLIALLPLLVWC